jgi:hypothetical protein
MGTSNRSTKWSTLGEILVVSPEHNPLNLEQGEGFMCREMESRADFKTGTD